MNADTNENGHLTTADLARASEEGRGAGNEAMIGREGTQQAAPINPAAPVGPPSHQLSAGERHRETEMAERNPQREIKDPSDAQPAEPARDGRAPLFAEHDASALKQRWSDVQTGFVDEPRRAVEQADSLVADVMKRLAEGFAAERTNLERQWDRGDNVTTEDLRVALQRYRSFFDRLLAV